MFLVYGDDNSTLKTSSVVMPALVVLNVLMFAVQSYVPQATMGWALIPYELSTGIDLVGEQVVQVAGKDVKVTHEPALFSPYLGLLTSMFMHAGWMHLLNNMLFLVIFGDQIEDRLGKFKFLLFYLLTGLLAGLAFAYTDLSLQIPMLGASGAVSGVIAAYVILHPLNELRAIFFFLLFKVRAVYFIVFWFMQQIFGVFWSQGSSVAFAAHLGGFFFGLVILSLMLAAEGKTPPRFGKL